MRAVSFRRSPIAGALPILFALAAAASAQPPRSTIDLPWKRVVLSNGLTLLMQPDSTVSLISVQLWMRGGAREESVGQHGIAHLFEHDLPYGGRFFTAPNRSLLSRSQTNGGAGTDYDFLRFYADVRPQGLEAMLGSLADRMESDSAKFTDERLRRDQDIVMSEIRRGTNVDWDLDVANRLAFGTFGAGHPYAHAVSGTEADVRGATAAVMRDWHRRFAGAANAMMIVVGHLDPAATEAMVRRHFGSIAPGEVQARPTRWIPRPVDRRDELEKDVSRGVVYLRWPAPAWGEPATADMTLLAAVLNDRAARRATAASALDSLSASTEAMELAGTFTLRGVVKPAASADSAEAEMRAVLAQLLRDGVTTEELARARARNTTAFVLGLQQLGDRRGGRADAVGLGQYLRGDPDRWRIVRARLDAAMPAAVRDTARRWLGEPAYALHVLPRRTFATATPYDRSTTVAPSPAPQAAAPELVERTLANGMRISVVARPALPLAQLTLAFAAGSGTDTPDLAGRARVALDALERLPADARGTPLTNALEELGARMETRLDRDYAILSVAASSDQVPAVMARLTTALSQPTPDSLLTRTIHDAQRRLEGILVDPIASRARSMGCLLYRPCDPEGLDGMGTAAGLARLTPAAIRAFYDGYYQPSNALLIASGRVDTAALERRLGGALAGRGGKGTSQPALATLTMTSTGGAAIIDLPAAAQTHLLLAQPLAAEVATDPAMLHLARLVNFTLRQRLMANLRESKGWSYEVYPFTVETSRQGAFLLYNIPLQPDRVGDAIGEIQREVARLRDDTLSTAFLTSVSTAAASAAAIRDFSSLARINDDVLELARSGRPAADYVDAQRALAAMPPSAIRDAVRAMLDPARLLWVLAGRADGVRAELAKAAVATTELPAER